MFKSFLKHILCFICIVSALFASFTVAADEEYKDGHIIIDTVSAINGDSVIVKISIENNPGIMAMTLSITYDSSVLEYERFYTGFLRDYTVADHPDKNLIRFVNCESRNRFTNSTMISLQFKVKEDADFGFYPIDIDYKSGDFSNWALNKLMPSVTSGGINIEYNGSNCSHKKYGEWEVAAEPSCAEPGAKQRVCRKCGHVEIKEIPAAGHDYEDYWTVDTPATEDSYGTMSRHCKNCDSYTDLLTFTLEESKDNNLENSSGQRVDQSDFTDKLVKEQLPESSQINSDVDKTDGDKQSGDKQNGGTEEIVDSIIGNSDGPIGKILEAVPDFKKLSKLVFAALIILLRLLLV